MVLAFFYQVIYVIFGALFLIYDNIESIKFKSEIKLKNHSEVQSELIVKSKDK